MTAATDLPTTMASPTLLAQTKSQEMITSPSQPSPSPSPSLSPRPSSTSSISDETKSAVEVEFKPNARFLLAFAALAVITLMASVPVPPKKVALDGTSISVALPIIAQKLHGSALSAFWSGTSFLLTSTVFQPSYASFSHIFGRKPLVLVALTFFTIGVLVAALANNFTALLVGRSLQGVGGGGIIAMTEIIVTDLVPLRFRGQWVGIIGAMWSIGSVTGPIVGGAFAQDVTWRWIFWLNLPFAGAAYIMVPLFLRLNFVTSSMASKLRRVDWAGSVMFVGSMSSFLIPLTWGGVMFPWDSWRTLVPLIVGVVGLIAFGFYEVYVAAEPVIRLAIFANKTANIAYVNTVFHGMTLWCLLYYQPLYFEAVQGYTPIISGIALFPATFTVAPLAVVTGITMTKTGRYRPALWLGWALTTLGIGLLCLLDVNTKIVQWIFIDVVSGVGLGILFPSLQFQLQAASSAPDLAFAVAMFSFFRAFGQALGVAIGGVIFQNQLTKHLASSPIFASRASELAKNAAALVQVIKAETNSADKLVLRTAYTDSLRTIYIVMCAIAGFALVLNFGVKHYSLDRGLETEQGFAYEKKEKDVRIEGGEKEVP